MLHVFGHVHSSCGTTTLSYDKVDASNEKDEISTLDLPYLSIWIGKYAGIPWSSPMDEFENTVQGKRQRSAPMYRQYQASQALNH